MFVPLATIAIALRFASRIRFSYIGKDDIATLLAYNLFIVFNVATVFALKYDLGIHIWDVDYRRTGMQMQQVSTSSRANA